MYFIAVYEHLHSLFTSVQFMQYGIAVYLPRTVYSER